MFFYALLVLSKFVQAKTKANDRKRKERVDKFKIRPKLKMIKISSALALV